MGGDSDFPGPVNQVEIRHEFGHRSNHFPGQGIADPPDHRSGGGIRQQPFPEIAHAPALDLFINGFVDRVINDTGHLIGLIGHRRIGP